MMQAPKYTKAELEMMLERAAEKLQAKSERIFDLEQEVAALKKANSVAVQRAAQADLKASHRPAAPAPGCAMRGKGCVFSQMTPCPSCGTIMVTKGDALVCANGCRA